MIQLDNAVKRFGTLILNEMDEVDIKCWIAGGSLRDYFMGVPITTDYDVFFPNQLEFEKAKIYFKMKGAEIKWESDNGLKMVYKDNTYDLVKKYFASPQETINAFDFTVSMFAVDLDKVYYGESTFIDLAKKQLIFNKITYPASTLNRAFRYYKKGFGMCDGEMKKLFHAIQDAPNQSKDIDIAEKLRMALHAPTVRSVDENADNELSTSGDEFWTGID